MVRGVPDPYEAALILAAGWRVWHLLAIDAILDPVRDRLFYPHEKGKSAGLIVEGEYERWPRIVTWLECPYCAGFWVTALVWATWAATPWALVVWTPFALHTGMVTVEKYVGFEND